jgi:hypothetical protein
MRLFEEVLLFESKDLVGFERERSKELSFLDDDKEFLESKALFQNPKSISSSVDVLFQFDVVDGFVFGGLICKDKSGCAGNSSIFFAIYTSTKKQIFFFFLWFWLGIVSTLLFLHLCGMEYNNNGMKNLDG